MPLYPGVFSMSGKSGAVATYGLIDFGNNNSTQYYSIADTPLLDLGSGAWAWFMWTKVDDNTGTAYQYLLSSGVQPNTPSFVWYLGEASADIAGEQNRFVARIVDDAGVNTGALVSTVATGADSVERLVVLQSTGTTVEMWLCPKNGTATRVVNASVNLGAITAPTTWNLGRKSDGDAARYWEEWLGGAGQANAAMSQANIEAIAGGAHPTTVLGATLENYWSFVGKTIGQNQDGTVGSPTTATFSLAYIANAVTFDGTNDYLTRGATLTGAADSKLWSGSLWFRRASASGVTERFIRNDPARVAVVINTAGNININGNNAANTVILNITTATAITDTNWHHIMWSVDLADTAKRFIYLDGAASMTVTTYTNDTLDFTSTNWGIGAGADGTLKFNGDLSEVWIALGQYIDLSVQSNREKFLSSANRPVNPGGDGSTPTGTAPTIWLSGMTSTWHTNDGTGGGFTVTGALTTAGSNP